MEECNLHVMGTAEIHACANYSMRTFLFSYFIIMAITLVGSGHSNFNFPCLNFISLACQDDYVSCLKWKARGDCKKNVKFMSKHCARSCDTCGRMVCRHSDRPFTFILSHLSTGIILLSILA